ncbi:cell division protein ZapA [Clostridiaceae bacterium 35-E11]
MSNKNKVIVRIYGQEYTMVGWESREYMQKVANYVDDKMIDIAKNSKKLSTAMVAVLTALNVADEYFKTKVEVEKLEKEGIQPLKELEQAQHQLETIKQEFQEKETKYVATINQLEEEKKNRVKSDEICDRFKKEIENLKIELRLKESELKKATKTNEELQNKLFDSQIKYVQVKKELDAFIETFDEEKK